MQLFTNSMHLQLCNCHNNFKSEVQAKLISMQINLLLLGSRKGFFSLMSHFDLQFTYSTFFNSKITISKFYF